MYIPPTKLNTFNAPKTLKINVLGMIYNKYYVKYTKIIEFKYIRSHFWSLHHLRASSSYIVYFVSVPLFSYLWFFLYLHCNLLQCIVDYFVSERNYFHDANSCKYYHTLRFICIISYLWLPQDHVGSRRNTITKYLM